MREMGEACGFYRVLASETLDMKANGKEGDKVTILSLACGV